jgi:hypothetical protein
MINNNKGLILNAKKGIADYIAFDFMPAHYVAGLF